MNEICDKCGIDLTDIAVNKPKIATFRTKNEVGYEKLHLCDRCYSFFQKAYGPIKDDYTKRVLNWLQNEKIPTPEEEAEKIIKQQGDLEQYLNRCRGNYINGM